eukprot:3568140-Prymnesium_polylepis.1
MERAQAARCRASSGIRRGHAVQPGLAVAARALAPLVGERGCPARAPAADARVPVHGARAAARLAAHRHRARAAAALPGRGGRGGAAADGRC